MNLNIGLLLGDSLLAREIAIFFKNFKKKEINIKFIQSNLSMKEYLKKIKKVKNMNKSFKKIQAFNHAPHEPAYIKINSKKIFLLTDYSEYLYYRGFKK